MPKNKLEFKIKLSFAQELRETPLGSQIFLPASNTISDPQLKGSAYLIFNEQLSQLSIELNIYGCLTGDQAITLAHLHLDNSSQTGPITVELYPNPKAKVKHDSNKEFNLKIKLNNSDVIPVLPRNNANGLTTNTIASLYYAIKSDSLYIDCHGGGDYILGMMRGQIYKYN